MTDLPGVLAPWMMLTAQDLRTAAEDGDDSGAPDARPAAARVIVDPLVAEGTLVVAGGMEIALRRLSYLIAPAGWSVPSLLQGERVYPLPFSEPILNLADASLAAYGLSQYQVTIEWLDGVTGNICWRSKRTLTCDASVSSVSIASLVPGTPSNVVQRVVPIDPTTPDGVPLALTGGKIGEYTGTTDHRGLTHRDAPDQHPMDAITGLGGALDDAAAAGQAAVIAHAAAPDPHPQYTTTGEAAAAAPVQSVAGRTGAVTLSAADITGLAEAAQDAVAAMLASGANVTLTYDDAADRLTVSASGGDAELMRDTLGAALVGVGGVVVTPDDAADTITISLTGVPIAAISGLQAALDARVLGTDPRLSDPRTPTAHAATHAAGGTDALAVTSLGVGTLADGQYLMRSGTALVGGVPSGGQPTPQDFGAVADGVTDDGPALQAWLDSVPIAGGVLHLPAGKYNVPNGWLTCDAPVQIVGDGTGSYETDSGGSRILCSHATRNLLTLSAPGSVVTGVTFENTGTIGAQTAGAALLCTDFDWGRIERCMFIGFFHQLQVDEGYFYSVRNTAFLRPVNYGAYMRNIGAGQGDHGDQVLEGCNFSKYGDPNNGGYAIRWVSGGGLRVIGCKVNAGTQPGYPTTGFWNRGISTAIGSTTSVHTITGCSIEGFLQDGIRVETTTGGNFGKVSITGNELLSSGGSNYYAITLDGSVGGMNDVVITGNVAYGLTGGVAVRSSNGVTITSNNLRGCTGGDGIRLTKARNVQMRDNLISTQIVDDDAANTTESVRGRNRQPYSQTRDLFQMSTSMVGGRVQPATWSAGVLRVVVSGDAATVGAFYVAQERAITRGSGAVSVGATIGTDVAVGAGLAEVAVAFDTATTSGWVLPTVSSVNGKSITGMVEVTYQGRVTTWSFVS